MKLVWRYRAELQLRTQYAYLKKANPFAAKRMRARIKQRLARLARSPFAGTPSSEPGVRELVISQTPYIIAYAIEGNAVVILGFFHTSQKR